MTIPLAEPIAPQKQATVLIYYKAANVAEENLGVWDFDFETLTKGFRSLGDVIRILKEAKDLLPKRRREPVEKKLEEVEQTAKLAEAQIAQGLGYEMLTGFRPFRASTLSRLLNQIVFATAAPIHTLRSDVPEELEDIVAKALQKDPADRYTDGGEFSARLTQVFQGLRDQYDRIDNQEHFDLLRRLSFFHDFSQQEIWELLRASEWREYIAGDEIVREGEMDDRFYVIVSGRVLVVANEQVVGCLESGDCFGEASYVSDVKTTSTVKAEQSVTVLSVSATLLEQVSSACQLRFTKVFLRALIMRLQGAQKASA